MSKELSTTLKSISLPSISDASIRKIEEFFPEVYRATKSFGRKNSQTTARLMSLTMMTACSPYRVMRQCLAEIEKRKLAIQEAVFSLRSDKVKAERLRNSADDLEIIEAERLELKIREVQRSIEGSLKDIATFQEAYIQVRDKNGIRENWDEADFEKAEVIHHVRTAFQHAYRDVMANGRIGMGTLEYLEQFGIHPQCALKETVSYHQEVEKAGVLNVDSEHLHKWLDSMAEKYWNNHKTVLSRMGIESAFSSWPQYIEE